MQRCLNGERERERERGGGSSDNANFEAFLSCRVMEIRQVGEMSARLQVIQLIKKQRLSIRHKTQYTAEAS